MAAFSVLPVMHLERMCQLGEVHTSAEVFFVISNRSQARDEGDDWTGITDAASRRKTQNRHNVRTHREFPFPDSRSY